jgi:hypothetical protein
VGVVDALSGDGDDALVGEEELLYGAFCGSMAAVRGVAFKLWAVQRRHASLKGRQLSEMQVRRGERTHLAVARP